MILKQKRIRNLSKLAAIKEGTKVVPIVRVENIDVKTLLRIGFSSKLEIGESILPRVVGAITRYNSEGRIVVHRDKPKETYYIMKEWTYKKWIGGGQTEEVTDWVDVPRKRYPRTLLEPMGIEIIIMEDENHDKLVCLPEILFNESNSSRIIHEVNIMLELFGECEIVNSDLKSMYKPALKKLNWKVLPTGEIPWTQRKKELDSFIAQARGKNSDVIRKRLEAIYAHNPDFVAVGNGGFGGYLILGFEKKNLYVLESTQVNNATYILEYDWKEISKLTKAEILNNKYHKDRVIHGKKWFEEIDLFLAKH